MNCPEAESYTNIQTTSNSLPDPQKPYKAHTEIKHDPYNVDSNEGQDYDRDAAGRTYFFEQKWNPKTRY